MKTNTLILAILVLTIGVVGCQKKQEPVADTASKTMDGLKKASTTATKDLKNAAKDAQKGVEDAANKAKQEAEKGAAEAKKKADAAANKLVEEGKKLLGSTQGLLDSGNYEGALKSAQEMISKYGADSEMGKQAQGIIAKAKEMIKKAAGEQAGALKDGLSDKLKTLGQ